MSTGGTYAIASGIAGEGKNKLLEDFLEKYFLL